MKSRGRPPLASGALLYIWVLVELLRDRKDPKRERASARDGCRRLKEQLRRDCRGGRVLPLETIRRLHKNFEATMRKSDSRELAATANDLLSLGRQRREDYGWDASVWLFVIEPDFLADKGVKVELMTH
jgi:hypothetical protein